MIDDSADRPDDPGQVAAPEPAALPATDPTPAIAGPADRMTAPRPAWVSGRAFLAALIPSGVALVVTTVLAGLALVLLSLVAVQQLLESGLGSAGTSAGGLGSSADTAVSGGPLGVLVFLGSLILLGAGSVHVSGSGVGIGGTVTFPALLLTAVVVLLTAWSSYVADRVAPARTRVGILVLSAVSGVAFAIVWTVVALLTAVAVSSSGAGLSLSGASVRTTIAALLVVGAASALGRIAARRAPARGPLAFPPALRDAIRSAPAGLHDLVTVAVVGAVVFGAVTLVGGLISIGVNSGWGTAFGTLLLWWGPGTAVAAVLGQGGAVWTLTSYAVSDTNAVNVGFASVVGGVSPLLWLLILVALLVAVVSALRIGARRRWSDRRRLATAWQLPVLTASAWLILGWACLSVFAEVSGGAALFGGGSAFVLVSPAPWFFLVAGLWAAGIEALARFAAPPLLATYPRLARLAGSPEDADLPPALGAGGRRGLLVGGLVGGAVVVLVAAGIGTVTVLGATVFGPQAVASSYLDSIAAGDAATANRMAAPGADSPLLTRAALSAASNRISDVRITSTSQSGSSATVGYRYRVAGASTTGTLTLRDRGDRPLFGDWRVSRSAVGQIAVYAPGVASIRINGVAVPVKSGEASVAAYPGRYRVALASSKWFAADPATVRLDADGTASAQLERKPTVALKTEVTAQVTKIIDACAATGQPQPPGCPFEEYVFGDTSGFAWTVTSYPTVELSDDGASFQLSGGGVHAEYDETFFGSTEHESDDAEIYGYGKVKISGDTVSIALQTF